MKERTGTIESFGEQPEPSDTVTYFTMKGKDSKDNVVVKDGNYVQLQSNEFTYAKCCGVRRELRVDDNGQLINPINAMFQQKNKLGRFKKVTAEAFDLYVDFLTTKKEKSFLQANRIAKDNTI
jgi:hypothetical protein